MRTISAISRARPSGRRPACLARRVRPARALAHAATTLAAVATFGGAAAAQQPGTMELGGFGLFTRFDDNTSARDRLGTGMRLGIFVAPRLTIEGEASYVYTDFLGATGGRLWYSPLALRAVYHAPAGRRATLLMGAGVVRSHYYYADEAYDAGSSALLGARLSLTDHLALRVDGVADYMTRARDLNLGARTGLSVLYRAPQPASARDDLGDEPAAGTMDVGAFAQHATLDDGLGGDRSFGLGARLGVFITPRIMIEGELSTTTVDSTDRKSIV